MVGALTTSRSWCSNCLRRTRRCARRPPPFATKSPPSRPQGSADAQAQRHGNQDRDEEGAPGPRPRSAAVRQERQAVDRRGSDHQGRGSGQDGDGRVGCTTVPFGSLLAGGTSMSPALQSMSTYKLAGVDEEGVGAGLQRFTGRLRSTWPTADELNRVLLPFGYFATSSTSEAPELPSAQTVWARRPLSPK